MSAASGLLVAPALQRHTARRRRLYVRLAPALTHCTIDADQVIKLIQCLALYRCSILIRSVQGCGKVIWQ
jgi:hypothetical protein